MPPYQGWQFAHFIALTKDRQPEEIEQIANPDTVALIQMTQQITRCNAAWRQFTIVNRECEVRYLPGAPKGAADPARYPEECLQDFLRHLANWGYLEPKRDQDTGIMQYQCCYKNFCLDHNAPINVCITPGCERPAYQNIEGENYTHQNAKPSSAKFLRKLLTSGTMILNLTNLVPMPLSRRTAPTLRPA